MRSRWFLTSTLLIGAWALGAGITGCSKKTTAPKPPAERVNEYKPNANARITSQTILGDADKKTDFGYIQRADDASLGFRGVYNSSAGVGVLNAGGSLRWLQAGTTGSVNVSTLPGNAIVPNGLVAVGGHDTDGDGKLDVGYASLYSSAGRLLSQVPVTSDSSDVWFYRLVSVAHSTFIACGGERRSGVEHPLLALQHLRAPGVIERGRTVTLQGITGYFNDVATLPSPPGELSFAATSRSGASGSFGGSSTVHRLRAPWPGFDPVAVEWSREIVPPTGSWVLLNDLEEAGGNLYVAGIVNDNRKPAPSGGAWTSGLAASYTGSGDLRWVTTDSLTQRDDGIYRIVMGPDALYAVDIAAEYYSGSDREWFGYGLISKLDLNTGRVIANFTLGQDRYRSLFYTATWTASGLICGGVTESEVVGGPFRGWFSTVDVSGTMPAPAAARRGAPDLDAAPGPTRGWDREFR